MATTPPSQAQRKLSARRGSVSASDPYGRHSSFNDDPARTSSSRLTIVRLVDPTPPSSPINLADPPSSPVLHQRRSLRRQSQAGGASTNGADRDSPRLSFAFPSFSPTNATNNLPPSPRQSPTTSPRLRPSSPNHHRRLSVGGVSPFGKPALTPDQLYDLVRQSSNPRYVNPCPASAAFSPSSPQSPGSPRSQGSGSVAPASFTPLPDDVYLPFIERPAEVSQLLATPPTTKLIHLLAQTFPKNDGSPALTMESFADNPIKWTFPTLRLWLTTVDRDLADDRLWVKNARKCVLAHSELIWERLKGALGVPPELEFGDEEDEEEEEDASKQSESPEEAEEPITAPKLSAGALKRLDSEGSTDNADTPVALSPPVRIGPPETDVEDYISIEPIVATSGSGQPVTPGQLNPPPLSLPSNLSSGGSEAGLEDIGEEEENEENAENQDKEEGVPEEPLQVHGLRICTSPTPRSAPVFKSWDFPGSPGGSTDAVSPSIPHQAARISGLSRNSSHGSLASLGSAGRPSSTYSYTASDFGDIDSERGYDPLNERTPGNPLFPSNFARLAVGPTLRANNPKSRTPRVPVATYPPHIARWARNTRPSSWLGDYDPSKQEYAITVASGSSVAGE